MWVNSAEEDQINVKPKQAKRCRIKMKSYAHRSWKFDDSDFLRHLLALEASTPCPLHHSSFSAEFRSLSLSQGWTRWRSIRYVPLRNLNGLDRSTRSVYVLQSAVPSLLHWLQLILLGLLNRPGRLLLLNAAFYHLQPCLDIGTGRGGLSSTAGRDSVTYIASL